ncbi:DUF1385 domain-containing protein [candidate division KSB1 bacterium]
MPEKELNIGGQAVIEGVMMRSEKFLSIAVRRPDGKIALKRENNTPWSKRFKFLKIPFFRGGVILIESLIHGVKALSWSSEIAMTEEEKENEAKKSKSELWSKIGTVFSLIIGLGVGFLLFFWLPLEITEWLGAETGTTFNLIDGGIRLAMFFLYIVLISLWKEIRRVFQYHGAEHKSIFALENDCPLTIEGAKPFTTLHPRCGTSFLLVVMVVSIMVFMFLGKPETFSDRMIRFLFLPVIGGISYEFIRFSSKHRDNKLTRIFILPGLWLQKITTKEPDDTQLEVGIVSLRSARGENLDSDNIVHYDDKGEIKITASDETSLSNEEVLVSSHDN